MTAFQALWAGTAVILAGVGLQVIDVSSTWFGVLLGLDEERTERIGRAVMWVGVAVAVTAGIVHLAGWA